MPGAPCVRAFAVLSFSLYSYAGVCAQDDSPLAGSPATLGILPALVAESTSGPTATSYLVSTSTSGPQIKIIIGACTSSWPSYVWPSYSRHTYTRTSHTRTIRTRTTHTWPTQPCPTQPCPTKPCPTKPCHTQPCHTQPCPHPWPTHSWPTHPWPTQPWPTHSWPIHSVPTHSRSTHSRSTHSVPTHSRSTHSRSTHSRSTHSRSTHSRSTHSQPTQPWPTHWRPTHWRPTHSWPTHSVSTITVSTVPAPTISRSIHSWPTHSRSTHSRSTHSRSTHSRSTHSRSTQPWPTHSRPTHSRPTHSWPSPPPRLCLPTSLVPSDVPVFAIINQSPARRTPITPGEAVTVCRSPPWELKLSNWIWSNAQEWLELYTLKYKDSYDVSRHGLVGSIAHRYLGEPNFRCGIGMTQTCVAWCKDVVMAVEDLQEAKNVYFVLSSISHFTGVADLVHTGLDSAQGNVGLMAPRMAHTFFWWKETPDDQKRAMILHFTLLSIQNLFKIMSPFVPWLQVLDKLSEKLTAYGADLARAKEEEHIAWLFMRTAHLLNVEWGWTMRNGRGIRTLNQERGFYLHATGFRGDRTERYWRDDYGCKDKHWWNYKGEEWTPSKRSFWKCNNMIWRTPRGGNFNAMDQYTRDGWKRREDENPEEGGNMIPPSHGENQKLGYWQEKTKDFNDLVKWKQERDKDGSQLKVDLYKMGFSAFTGWIPEAILGINMWSAQPESQDREPEFNGANLAMAIGKMASDSRQGLKAGVIELMNPKNISETGETTLSVLLARGHYLPANDYILKSFTASDVEEQITKNVFFKTLNAALKAQQIYITCTADHKTRKNPTWMGDGVRAQSCNLDNSGPQNLKACVPYTSTEAAIHGIGNGRDPGELACYMYKWAARGRKARHHNEAPFGSDEWKEWGVSSAEIITSSVRTYLLELQGYELVDPLSTGTLQTAKSISRPDTPGVFTIPVCVSRYNLNAPIESFTILSELNPNSPSKRLPCDCGFWGEDTEKVWKETGLWSQTPEYYRMTLCPRQTNSHTSDKLQKWVSNCRLGTKKSGGSRRFGRDSRCGVVTWLLSELKKRGVPADLPDPVRLGIWCRINKGWWSRLNECKGVTADTPWGSILDELDGVVREVGEETLGKAVTEGDFLKQLEDTEPVEELLLKPFGIGSGKTGK